MGVDDKMQNKAEELVGKGKEALGDIRDDPDLKAEGQAEETKANVKQAAENVKDAFK